MKRSGSNTCETFLGKLGYGSLTPLRGLQATWEAEVLSCGAFPIFRDSVLGTCRDQKGRLTKKGNF